MLIDNKKNLIVKKAEIVSGVDRRRNNYSNLLIHFTSKEPVDKGVVLQVKVLSDKPDKSRYAVYNFEVLESNYTDRYSYIAKETGYFADKFHGNRTDLHVFSGKKVDIITDKDIISKIRESSLWT